MTVSFGAGVTYQMLVDFLKEDGSNFALPNPISAELLPSEIAGSILLMKSCENRNYLSGVHFNTMASLVSQVSFIDSSGLAKILSRDSPSQLDKFNRFLHSFGTLGVVYEMQIELV